MDDYGNETPINRRPATHWDGCWLLQNHHDCAVAYINLLCERWSQSMDNEATALIDLASVTARAKQAEAERDALRAQVATMTEARILSHELLESERFATLPAQPEVQP